MQVEMKPVDIEEARRVRARVIDEILRSPRDGHGREELEAMSPTQLHERAVAVGLGPQRTLLRSPELIEWPRGVEERNRAYLRAKALRKILAHPENTRTREELEELSYGQLRVYAGDRLGVRLRAEPTGSAGGVSVVDIEHEEREQARRLGIDPDTI